MPKATKKFSRKEALKGLFNLIRPRQWVKNGFVFAPLIFSGQIHHGLDIQFSFLTFVLFCIAASSAYVINDLCDIESDRQHPQKFLSRPLAAGTVTRLQACSLLSFLYSLLIISYFILPEVVYIILVYIGLNIAYSIWLKHQPILDIFAIALGFVLRVYAGAEALSLPISLWMFVTTLCLALYLAAIKRRQELAHAVKGIKTRKVLQYYSVDLVDRYAQTAATCSIIFYSLFVMNTRPQLVLTIPLVIFGLFRYWYTMDMQNKGESPTDVLLSDWPLIITIILWIILCIWFIW